MNNNFKQFLQDRDKELRQRVKRIVKYTLEDFFGNGYSTEENSKELNHRLQKEILSISGIDDMNTYEISLRVLEMLNSLDIVDLEFIHKILLKRDESAQVTISFVFDEVV